MHVHDIRAYIHCAVMNETNGDGVGRIVDASGVSSVVNNCFTMLRQSTAAREFGCQLLVLCVQERWKNCFDRTTKGKLDTLTLPCP